MVKLTIYDPALCCSTGVCGPAVDPVLVQFAADLDWLRARGADVRRFNLAQEPAEFAQSPLVRRRLQEEGTSCLPLMLLGMEVVSSGRYPARDELAAWSQIDAAAEAAPGGTTSDVAADRPEPGPVGADLPVLRGEEGQDDRSTRCC